MDPTIPYLLCVIGAAALYLMLRPGRRAVKTVGALAGLGALVWMLVDAAQLLGQGEGTGAAGARAAPLRPDVVFVIFSLIAIAAAVRMITHSRPVYSALYFIMVVLSSAGLFLMLQAEFMAFALVIVYAGAILITYMFVLMLAQQAPSPDRPDVAPEYDIQPREPAAAAVVGLIMLALFSKMIFGGAGQLQPLATAEVAQQQTWQKLDLMRQDLAAIVQQQAPGSELAKPGTGGLVMIEQGVPYVDIIRPGESRPTRLAIPPDALPSNLQLVGLDLVAKFPVSLELAGVILLLAMFGAVVLARKQIELGEDELREAAGMRRLSLHADEPAHTGSDGKTGGGSA